MATTENPITPNASSAPHGEGDTGGIKDKIGQAASHLKSTAGEYGHSAAEHLDRNVHNAAGALENTATKLRSQAGEGGGKVSEFAQTAAGKLDSAALSLRDFDTEHLVSKVETWTRQNPALAIGSALAIGFVIGMTLKKKDSDY